MKNRDIISTALLLCLVHQSGYALELSAAQLWSLELQQRRPRLLGGIVEERLEDVSERGPARGIAPQSRTIYVRASIFLVADATFLLERSERCTNRRVTRRI